MIDPTDDANELNEARWRLDRENREIWIPIDKLTVKRDTAKERNYQREGADKTVQAVSTDFRYTLFDRIWVIPLANGLFEVVDGGGRIDGLKKKGYRGCVPCCLDDARGDHEAARSLGAHNSGVAMSAFRRYVAAHIGREPWAVDITQAINQYGLELAGKTSDAPDSKRVACVWTLRKVWASTGKEGVESLLKLAHVGFKGDLRVFEQNALRALHTAMRGITALGVSVDTLAAMFTETAYSDFILATLKIQKAKTNLKAEMGSQAAAVQAYREFYNANARRLRLPRWTT